MGIKKFFKKIGGWVKDKFHKAKNVVAKFAKPVLRVGKKIIDVVGKTPIAPVIDKLTHVAFSIAKGISNLIPDGAVKDNANKFISNAEQVRDQAVGKVADVQAKTNYWIDKGKDAINIVKNRLPKPGMLISAKQNM
jgi:hypothetical protein